MLISVVAKPNSRKPGIEKMPDGTLKVRVSEHPDNGKANEAVTHAIAEYLDVPPSTVTVIRGTSSHHKVVSVPDSR